jgi:hypothetical protein
MRCDEYSCATAAVWRRGGAVRTRDQARVRAPRRAGNKRQDACDVSPASAAGAVAVGAVDVDATRWPGSNWSVAPAALLGGRGQQAHERVASRRMLSVDARAGDMPIRAWRPVPAQLYTPLALALSRACTRCRGACVDLHAPGVNIISAVAGNDVATAAKTGTSMAVRSRVRRAALQSATCV